jgi:hypothetical protein
MSLDPPTVCERTRAGIEILDGFKIRRAAVKVNIP